MGTLRTPTTAGGRSGGGKRDRTADLLHAMQALSQLSYTPTQGRELYHAGRRSRSRASTRFLPATASVGPSSGVLVRPKTIRRSGIAIFGKGKPYLSSTVRTVLDKYGLPLPKIAMPLRLIVFGRTKTPELGPTLAVAGKKRVLARLRERLPA